MGRREEILEKVREIAAPLAAAEGLELVDVELAGAGGHPTLRVYIDKIGGVSLDDCTLISRALSTALDVQDPIEGSYELEVSSPGLDRPLRTPEHFQQFAGEKVRIKTFGPLEEAGSRKTFVGRLIGLEGEDVLTEVEGAVFRIPQKLIAKANVEPSFDGGLHGAEDAAPRARLSVDGRYLLVNGRGDVRRALRDIRKSARAEVWVRREAAALGALFHEGKAVLLLSADGAPLATSRNPRTGPGETDRLRVRRTSGEDEEYPVSWAVPGEDAARALEHFFLTGQRPSFIHWHDETSQH